MTTPATGVLFYEPRAKPLSTIGLIQPGCYYQFYLTGTTTPANVYADGALTSILSQTPGTGQTTASSDGRLIPIYLSPLITYRVQLYSAVGVLLEDTDPFVPVSTTTPTQAVLGQILWPQTNAEVVAGVTPTNFSYPPNNLLRYGADPSGVSDSTSAINQWLLVYTGSATSAYAPAGTYLTSGGHTINAKQDVYGDGIQRTIFQHTGTTNTLFSLPLYGGNQAAVEFGGNRIANFSCVGQGPSDSSEWCFYVKNKTDIKWDHVEITGFGIGVQGARDNSSNSCTDLSFIACRILNCGIGLQGLLQWNGTQILGGTIQGTIWSIIMYDSQTVNIDAVVAPASTAAGAVFLGGCQGALLHLYAEGSASGGSMVILADQVDVSGSATNNGIAIGRNRANKVHGGTYTSGSGVAYACKQMGGSGCVYEGIYAGSGIGSGVVFLTSGTQWNWISTNYSNAGVNAAYQTASDQSSNFETSLSTGVSHFGIIDTGSIYLDGANTSDIASVNINQVGYQGGTSHFRRVNIYDGKGTLLMQIDGSTSTVNISASTLALPNLPTTNPGAGSKQVWVNAGVLTRA